MSLPSVRRTVAGMPCACRMLLKAAIASRELGLKPGLRDVVKRNHVDMRAHAGELSFAKSSACSGLSLTPEIIVYSKDTRRPVIS